MFLLLIGLGLVLLGDHGAQMRIEKVIEFLGQSLKLRAVGVLDACGAHHSFEELALEDNLGAGVNVVWLDAEALVELLEVLLFFLLIAAARVVVPLLRALDLVLLVLGPVDEVELVHFTRAE